MTGTLASAALHGLTLSKSPATVEGPAPASEGSVMYVLALPQRIY